ncbi:MAG: sortase [Ruminococcaceae bacterium]|nr:sortase [Oscillospiraceae bacterium]
MRKSKRKERKRREEYNKAVKHKMESAADLADKYARVYGYSEQTEKARRKRNNKVVTRKLLYSVAVIALQTVALITVAVLVFLPFRNSFKDVLQNYFSPKKPEFSSRVVDNKFLGSENKGEEIDFNDVEQPETNECYAKLSSANFNGNIYFGETQEALLEGFCQDSDSSLPGFNKPILIYGYKGTILADIDKAETGEKISITTEYAVYEYKIVQTGSFKKSEEPPCDVDAKKELLIIYTDYNFDEKEKDYTENYYVIAEKVSGPENAY